MQCPYKEPTRHICIDCRKQYQMPNQYCCLDECGEHEFCRNCDKGVYLKKGDRVTKWVLEDKE